jgi:hypothetical protein
MCRHHHTAKTFHKFYSQKDTREEASENSLRLIGPVWAAVGDRLTQYIESGETNANKKLY